MTDESAKNLATEEQQVDPIEEIPVSEPYVASYKVAELADEDIKQELKHEQEALVKEQSLVRKLAKLFMYNFVTAIVGLLIGISFAFGVMNGQVDKLRSTLSALLH